MSKTQSTANEAVAEPVDSFSDVLQTPADASKPPSPAASVTGAQPLTYDTLLRASRQHPAFAAPEPAEGHPYVFVDPAPRRPEHFGAGGDDRQVSGGRTGWSAGPG